MSSTTGAIVVHSTMIRSSNDFSSSSATSTSSILLLSSSIEDKNCDLLVQFFNSTSFSSIENSEFDSPTNLFSTPTLILSTKIGLFNSSHKTSLDNWVDIT